MTGVGQDSTVDRVNGQLIKSQWHFVCYLKRVYTVTTTNYIDLIPAVYNLYVSFAKTIRCNRSILVYMTAYSLHMQTILKVVNSMKVAVTSVRLATVEVKNVLLKSHDVR